LPSLIYFSWDIYRDPPSTICFQISMHLKPTAGCQILILIFEKKLWRGVSINIPWKIYQRRQSSCPSLAKLKEGGKELFRPWYIFHGIFIETLSTICFQISKLIFDTLLWDSRVSNINFDIWKKNCGGGLYKYPIKNISRVGKNFAVLDLFFIGYV
jgi:hypothetical protein